MLVIIKYKNIYKYLGSLISANTNKYAYLGSLTSLDSS